MTHLLIAFSFLSPADIEHHKAVAEIKAAGFKLEFIQNGTVSIVSDGAYTYIRDNKTTLIFFFVPNRSPLTNKIIKAINNLDCSGVAISSEGITDKHLKSYAKIQKLFSLHIWRSPSVSDEALETLQKQLPNLKTVRNVNSKSRP